MFTDPATADASSGGSPTLSKTPTNGRRRFGEACLAGDRGQRQTAAATSGGFLRPDANGRIDCQILLLPDFELNELSALVDIFAAANRLMRDSPFTWRLASLDGAPVRSAGGAVIAVAESGAGRDAAHLFVLSGYGECATNRPSLSAWLCRRHAMGTRIAAIGGAGRLLVGAGLMNGRVCAVHWSLADALKEGAYEVSIEDRLYVIEERIATCAGRMATLDFALRLIADYAGDMPARQLADSFNHAKPREAGERQQSEQDFTGKRGSAAIVHTVKAMRRRMSDGDDLTGIADQAGVSQRQLQRLFRRHLGMTPTQYFLKARLQRARHLLQYSTLSVTEIAVATGFASISHFTRRYTELYGRTPTAERGRTGRRDATKTRGDSVMAELVAA